MKTKNGLKLYKYAKKIIPGGTTLFSKRSELHLPNKWPAFFSKAKDTNLWDLKLNGNVAIILSLKLGLLCDTNNISMPKPEQPPS